MKSSEKEMVPFPVIRKRDGRLSRFDIKKIASAIHRSFFAIGEDNRDYCEKLSKMVLKELLESNAGSVPQVEDIQDAVERVLIRERQGKAAKAFILYRDKRTRIREGKSGLMDSVETILAETDKDTHYGLNSPGVKMLKIASSASRSYYLTRVIPSRFAEAHNRGDIHIHDLEYYAKSIHSLQIPLRDMLTRGFYSGYGFIRPPKHIMSLSALVAIIIQSCQNDMHGGQSIPAFDEQISDYIKSNENFHFSEEEVYQAMQGLVYNLNMMYSRMGEQVPMSTINIGLDTTPAGRLITRALLTAIKDGLGKGETPLFPWVVFHVKDGITYNEDDPNYDLFQLAVETASKRMNPVFAFADSPLNLESGGFAYWGDAIRLSGDMFTNSQTELDGYPGITGRGVISRVTLSLPRVAFKISHKRKDFVFKSFYSELKRTLDLCARQLLHRREVLAGLKVNEIPFVMGEKIFAGSEDLALNDSIGRAVDNGLLSIGFIGLAEALFILFGKSFAGDSKVLEFGLETIDFMREYIAELSGEFEAPFILTASSSGYAARRFPLLDCTEFSITPYVNDKKYYTQGTGIPGFEKIPWEDKLEIEAKFHNKIPGGHFTFLESKASPSVVEYMEVLKKMKETGICYGGISFPLHESLEDKDVHAKSKEKNGRIRTIHRAAGLLLPRDLINKALIEELEQRKTDL